MHEQLIDQWLTSEIADPNHEATLRAAVHMMMSLSDEDRLNVWSWFCKGCGIIVLPNERCHCMNDE